MHNPYSIPKNIHTDMVYYSDMGLFGQRNKAVSKREFTESVRSQLSHHGLDQQEINEVAMIFRADLDEVQETQKGIDAQELSAGIAWMRKNQSMHHLSSKEIATVEAVLGKYL